jgi:hypothetical protein
VGSDAQSILCCLDRIVLAQKYNSRVGRNHTYLACGLNAAYSWEANVQENDSWMKVFSLLDSIFAVNGFAYDLKISLSRKD